MNKYDQVAIVATELYRLGQVSSPSAAWELSVKEIFPDSESSREKGCPRGAYLGLCEAGLITGIPSGKYSRSEKNKSYALEAVELIRGNLSLLDDVKKLWEKVMERVGDVGKMPNSQMEVVIALWNASLISTA